MKQLIILLLFSMGVALGQPTALYAVDNTATKAYQETPLRKRSFDTKDWNAAADGMKYTTKPRARKTRRRANTDLELNPNLDISPPAFTFRDFAETALIFLAVLVLVYVIFKAVGGDAILVSRQIERNKPIRLEDLETNLHEADVESFLDKSIREGNYRLAIRLYYLAIIKELSLKGIIEWKKDKTNGQYLRELRKNKYANLQAFRNVTRIFEYVWYSTMGFDQGKFKEVQLEFQQLLQTFK